MIHLPPFRSLDRLFSAKRYQPFWGVSSSAKIYQGRERGALLLLAGCLLWGVSLTSVLADEGASTDAPQEARVDVLADSYAALSLGAQVKDICAWERDLGFFLSREQGEKNSDIVPCAERFDTDNKSALLGAMKQEFSGADTELQEEIALLVVGYPIAEMAASIARYDREIAGLIVGIGKKESNWGKRTPKLNGEECYNFWGYRGRGTRGLTADGYGCWDRPEEAVRTIGDRLVTLRDVRSSAEPARMVVWKCGNTCAGHSDESVRKWISDVNFYYREIAFGE